MAVGLRTDPRRYQYQAVEMLQQFGGRALLADDVGLGKTLESLLYMWEEVLYPTVIVCPASIKWNWQNEIRQHFGMRSEVLCGTRPSRQNVYKPKIVIINYDILTPWMKFLRDLKPKLVILDEAHHISNYKTIRSKQVRLLCRSRKIIDLNDGVYKRKVIALTGTPFRSRHAELWHILHVIRPDVFRNWMSFAWRYCSPRRTPWAWEYKGSVRHKELNRVLRRNLMIRRTKEQVLKELPPKTRIVLPMDLSNKREYLEAQGNIRKWLIKNKKGHRSYQAERLTRFHYLKQLAAQLKMPAVYNWIDNFLANNDGKLVVFAVHRAILRELERRYHGQALRIDGSVIGRKRQRVIDAFQTNSKFRLCFCNISIASGFNLTAASTAAIIEYPWDPGTVIQAEGRIHRMTQKSRCMIYYQFGRGTIEEDLIKILQRRQKDSNATLDGDNESDEMDIFDQLEKLLLRRETK